MDRDEMTRLFEAHRAAEAARDIDGILATFSEDCYIETVPLRRRSEGKTAVRAAYQAYFTAFPDLAPDDRARAHGDDALVVWGTLAGTSRGDWLGVPPSGGFFAVQFTNIATFADGKMAGETIYFDLSTLCEQAGLPLDEVLAAARAGSGSEAGPR